MPEVGGAAGSAPHAFLAIPSYSGVFSDVTVASLEAACDLLKRSGWAITLGVTKGDCYIQRARNGLVGQFMESGADSLFFIDDDVGFPPEAMLRLLEMPAPVVFGVYPLKREEEGFPVVVHTTADGRPIVREDGCISAMGAPTGFLRIKRSVIERMHEAYPDRRYGDYDGHGRFLSVLYDLFPQGVREGRWWGEDMAFCHLWTALGGEIWCVPDIDFSHAGRDRVWTGNYHRFLLAQPQPCEVDR